MTIHTCFTLFKQMEMSKKVPFLSFVKVKVTSIYLLADRNKIISCVLEIINNLSLLQQQNKKKTSGNLVCLSTISNFGALFWNMIYLLVSHSCLHAGNLRFLSHLFAFHDQPNVLTWFVTRSLTCFRIWSIEKIIYCILCWSNTMIQ